MHAYLNEELLVAQDSLKQVQGPDFQSSSTLQRQSSEWARNSKQLRAKLEEYRERLAGLRSPADSDLSQLSVARLVEQEIAVAQVRATVEDLQAELGARGGLPTDANGARRRVREAANELEHLRSRRDRLFEGLVE